VGVTDLSPSIAIDRHLLPTAGRDRSASFAIDQKDLPIHRKDLSLPIVVYRDLHGYLSKSIMMPPKAIVRRLEYWTFVTVHSLETSDRTIKPLMDYDLAPSSTTPT
jgi:hypothetical protein